MAKFVICDYKCDYGPCLQSLTFGTHPTTLYNKAYKTSASALSDCYFPSCSQI